MRLVGVLVLACVASIAIGWQWGYQNLLAYARFWALVTLTLAAATRIVSRAFGLLGPDAIVRVALVSLALIVATGLALGSIGQISTAAYIAVASAFLLLSWFAHPDGDPTAARQVDRHAAAIPVEQQTRSDGDGRPPIPYWLSGLLGALATFAIAFALTHAPLTLYDSVSYHLFFASRWLQDARLSIIPTPFSDVAQAYSPANGELFLLWLMLPFHGDFLARFGQLPFAALGALVIYRFARRLGAAPPHAIYPAVFFALSRPILEQAVGANVDLICAVLFLTSLYFGLLAVESNSGRDWILFGVCLGLYLGTKYLALVYAPVFAVLLVARRPHPKMLWALAGIGLFALPWYLRNWVLAGSPIYPASVTVGGITVARGAFTRAAMLNTVFRTSDAGLLPTIAARALGPTLFLIWIPAAIVGGVQLARRRTWLPAFVVCLPFALLALYWFALPVNVDARFLMPAVAPALLGFAFTFRESRRWNAVVHALYALAALWIVTGTDAAFTPPLPWFMVGWWSLAGLVSAPFLWWFVALAVAIGVVWRVVSLSQWRLPAAASLILVPAGLLAVNAQSWCGAARCEFLVTTSPHIQPDLLASWTWVDAHVTNATVAYTGINLPYPLTGVQLTNRVVYVNTDGHPRWRFHDYDLAFRAGRFAPSDPPLASSSGELLPVAKRIGPRDDALRPRYERMAGSKAAWIGNLDVLGVTHVFIAALSPYEVDHVWHNGRGFPIEDDWAASEPALFDLVYENPTVHVYAATLPARARA